MHRQAVQHGLHFYETSQGVRTAARRGRLVELKGNADYRLHRVSFPYATASAKLFVERLAGQYRAACGERLVVTSATRPATRQPRNSTDLSVHPTGMAVDLRRPSGSCLTWLRQALLLLEEEGVIEATEERNPPHFHVAVFPDPYVHYVNARAEARLASTAGDEEPAAAPARQRTASAAASTRAAAAARYRVRRGDTLWAIARRHSTTVQRIQSLNGLSGSRIVPGQTLLVPAR